MCYVTTEAPAPINTVISEISLTEELHLFSSDTHKRAPAGFGKG